MFYNMFLKKLIENQIKTFKEKEKFMEDIIILLLICKMNWLKNVYLELI